VSPKGLEIHFNFLKIEADLALTFLRTSDIVARDDPKNSANALTKAREALATIQRFMHAQPFTSDQVAYLGERCAFLEEEIASRAKSVVVLISCCRPNSSHSR